ncbi:MAG: glycoside hydrolase family 71/99-like protein [Planctomycetota bacterium]
MSLCLQTAAAADERTREVDLDVVDASTLHGKLMCGYQGWFRCPGDGTDLGWQHWGRGRDRQLGRRTGFGPGRVTVDMWPDVSEYEPNFLYDTPFRHRDGRVARVFSSADRSTVMTHFRWMREYGIHGAFVQRFGNAIRSESRRESVDAVLSHVREAAEAHGRAYAVMYDLSSMRSDAVTRLIDDWRRLSRKERVTSDANYLRHNGKPLVAVWGVGFEDRHKKYSLESCSRLVRALQTAGCSVMLGVPTGWRTLDRDAVGDELLLDIIASADVISPWTVGRYRSPAEVTRHYERYISEDITWTESRGVDFLPVVFPGFSWANLKGEELGAIPRLRGEFFETQLDAAAASGVSMCYVAMFDEVDEGTAIFKCTDDPPVGDGHAFLDMEGLPSDHYLTLAGRAARRFERIGLSRSGDVTERAKK